MICTICKCDGEHKVFSTFQYWYCPSCKKEIELELVSAKDMLGPGVGDLVYVSGGANITFDKIKQMRDMLMAEQW